MSHLNGGYKIIVANKEAQTQLKIDQSLRNIESLVTKLISPDEFLDLGDFKLDKYHMAILGYDGNHGKKGSKLIEKIKNVNPSALIYPVVDYDNLDIKNQAWNEGISGIIDKPVNPIAVESIVKSAIQNLDLALIDPLTGIYNRRFLDRSLDNEKLRYKRHLDFNSNQKEYNLGFVLLDIDKFKLYNDSFGHKQGDQALIEVAEVIAKSVRPQDVIVRYGGEEFGVILPNTDQAKAMEVAERIRHNIETTNISWGSSDKTNIRKKYFDSRSYHDITVSLGITCLPDLEQDFDGLITSADLALYVAKEKGRNQSIIYTPELKLQNSK
jgi:diguanylate cyclase (GGDEF)-like protein